MGAFQNLSYNDGIEQAWTLARRYSPDLPKTYEEAYDKWEQEHGPGSLVRVRGEDGMVLSHKGDRYSVMLKNGKTECVEGSSVEFLGDRIALPEIISAYFVRVEAVGEIAEEIRRKSVYDETTGLRYKCIKDWCRDTGLSASSASRLLNGHVEEVKGHRLTYADPDSV